MLFHPLQYSESPIPIQRNPYGPGRVIFVSCGGFRYPDVFNMEQSRVQAFNYDVGRTGTGD